MTKETCVASTPGHLVYYIPFVLVWLLALLFSLGNTFYDCSEHFSHMKMQLLLTLFSVSFN